MSDQLYVDPGELRAAVGEVGDAARALDRGAAGLAIAGALARQGLDHGGRADDKVATFVRQWRREHELIAGLLTSCSAVLLEAAAAYESLELTVAAATAD